MAYGILIRNNIGSRKSVPVFDSRNPANAMLQLIGTFQVAVNSSGSIDLDMPETIKEIKDLGIAVYPNSVAGNLPNVSITGYTVSWNYDGVTNPTAVTIAVFT